MSTGTGENIPTDLSQDRLAALIGTDDFGYPFHTFGRCTSTNDVALRLAHSGTPHGTLVVADTQSKGRGRGDNVWHSEPGVGLWMSVVIELPSVDGSLSLTTASAAASAVERCAPESDVEIKWPNDLMCQGRKLGGILIEVSGEMAVLGLGLNVNHRRDQFPPRIRESATSIALSSGINVDRTELLLRVLQELDVRLELWRVGRVQELQDEWRMRSCVLGCRVELTDGAKYLIGTARELGDDGSLVIETEHRLVRVTAGHLRLITDR